jgi:hypothetical protein
MANKTFIGEDIFEFKPMGVVAPPMADPEPSPAPGGPGQGSGQQPEETPEQPEEQETPGKSNTLTYLAIGLLALYFLRRK